MGGFGWGTLNVKVLQCRQDVFVRSGGDEKRPRTFVVVPLQVEHGVHVRRVLADQGGVVTLGLFIHHGQPVRRYHSGRTPIHGNAGVRLTQKRHLNARRFLQFCCRKSGHRAQDVRLHGQQPQFFQLQEGHEGFAVSDERKNTFVYEVQHSDVLQLRFPPGGHLCRGLVVTGTVRVDKT